VFIENSEGYAIREFSTKKELDAIKKAKEWALKYKKVFIFFNKSSVQKGYINKNGADFTPEDWST
jgi:hypothetical protein